MKILSVSDFIDPMFSRVGRDERFAGVELILSCGDLPPEYLTTLAEAFRVPLYYVRGNHDRRVGPTVPGGGSGIHAQVVRYRGLSILGLDGSHWYNGGPHQYTESQMRDFIRQARPLLRRPGTLDIVLTHAAPRHVGDAEDLCHRGFRSFRSLIQHYRPRYLIHGHVHRRFDDPAERVSRVGQTRVVNSSGYYVFEVGNEAHGG